MADPKPKKIQLKKPNPKKDKSARRKRPAIRRVLNSGRSYIRTDGSRVKLRPVQGTDYKGQTVNRFNT